MAFDGFFCVAVANELNAWAGAKVEKIHQSPPTCLYLCLYREGKRANLILSAAASKPILAITTEEIAKPKDPTPFCMLFRKHLQNGRLTSVSCVPHERIVKFSFACADELGFLREKTLYAEMMGKYSNLILVNEDGRIVGATSTADLTASVRQVMPGMPYELPAPQEKFDVLTVTESDFFALLAVNRDMSFDRFLISKFFAFSPAVAREISFLASGSTETFVSELNFTRAWESFSSVISRIRENEYAPCAVYNGDKGVEYAYLPLNQYSGMTLKPFESFSRLLLSYFSTKEETVNIRSYAADILKTVNNHLAREEKKMGLQKKELQDCEKRETLRKNGDLLMANLYRLKNGMTSVVVNDYETGEDVEIAMDGRMTPVQNAQSYYKKYAKMKRASEALTEQLVLTERKIDHLESILDAVARAGELSDLEEIRRELTETGFLKSHAVTNPKKKKQGLSKPLTYTTTDGMTVRVGRNNLQNDALTASAEKKDLWFHIKKFHGSHVILVTNGVEPTDRDYTEAAMLAAFHSEKKGSSNVEVDYTRVKFLRKPAGSAPGFVTYETYYSAVVDARDPFATEKE
jgi:predicted ribosome quality control (RQC) complex YloA/Tae2 family protein